MGGEEQYEPPIDCLDKFKGTVNVKRQTHGLDNDKVLLTQNTEWCFGLLIFAGELNYQAQSPDESALVTAARSFDFVFHSRTPETITVMEMGKNVVYDLVAVLDFTHRRKRMSVIVRSPDGGTTLYCKGADTVLFERLHSLNKFKEATQEHLTKYAKDGLRTLVLGYKHIEESYLEEWIKNHHEASIAGSDREERLNALFDKVEKEMTLLGATAVEDRLQDGVTQTIELLVEAKIKIWMLTGDQKETAENIAHACHILRPDMTTFVVQGKTPQEVRKELQEARKTMCAKFDTESIEISRGSFSWLTKSHHLPDDEVEGKYGLVINGSSLAFALEEELELELLKTACMCHAVICCRATPIQRGQVVQLVKKYKQAVTLAVGDGANDVSMIKTAHIGVGISGQEGMQAVLSSDFSIAQFSYLQRLLLVHGRWSYHRMCKFLRYFLLKNFTFTFVHLCYAHFCGLTAQPLYDAWFNTAYNLVYTSLPVLALGLFDQTLKSTRAYIIQSTAGQLNHNSNGISFLRCLMQSIYYSIIGFFIPYGALWETVRHDGREMADYQSFAIFLQSCLIIVMNAQERATWKSGERIIMRPASLWREGRSDLTHSSRKWKKR